MNKKLIYQCVILRNMELFGRISKGSRMDQIYLPKNRSSLAVGSYVVVRPAIEPKFGDKHYICNLKYIEPIKLEIVKRVIGFVEDYVENENIIITGSFLNEGFNFGDLDIVLVTEAKINDKDLGAKLYANLGIKAHLIRINNRSLITGLESDPLFEMMLSRCISKKRLIYKRIRKINYQLLDFHLLKSRTLIDNFDILSGDEKYNLTRNIAAIDLFIQNKKISVNSVDKEIMKAFDLKNVDLIKKNILDRGKFLEKYKKLYKDLFKKILEGVKIGAK